MHGRPRLPVGVELDPEKAEAQTKKAGLFRKLLHEILRRKASDQFDVESMALCGKLVELSPEVHTGWNYRREFLERTGALTRWASPDAKPGTDAEMEAETELQLTERALQRNPKSYMAWHHRQWVLRLARTFVPLERELRLLDRLLGVDERNFHAWGHRRFVLRLMGAEEREGLDYPMRAIERNFSNFSAWHERARVLSLRAGDAGALLDDEVIDGEIELVQQAIFTEPDDQSAWVHLRWVVGVVLMKRQERAARGEDGLVADCDRRIDQLCATCRELLEADPGSKWANLTLGLLLLARGSFPTEGEAAATARAEVEAEAGSCFDKLVQVDPDRAGYYRDALLAGPCGAVRALRLLHRNGGGESPF